MKLKMLMVLIVVMMLSLCTGTLYAAGDLIVNGNLGVGASTPTEKAEINGNMKVTGNTALGGNATVQGNLVTNGTTTLIGNTTVQGDLNTNGSVSINGQLTVGTQGIKFANGVVQTTAIRAYESPEQTITPSGTLTLAHGKNAMPFMVQAWLVCKTAQNGYAVGEMVHVPTFLQEADAHGMNVVPDINNLNISFGSHSNVFLIFSKGTGGPINITPSNWKIIIRALFI